MFQGSNWNYLVQTQQFTIQNVEYQNNSNIAHCIMQILHINLVALISRFHINPTNIIIWLTVLAWVTNTHRDMLSSELLKYTCIQYVIIQPYVLPHTWVIKFPWKRQQVWKEPFLKTETKKQINSVQKWKSFDPVKCSVWGTFQQWCKK